MTWVVRKETFIETSQCIRLFSNMLETEKLFFSYGAVEVKKKTNQPDMLVCVKNVLFICQESFYYRCIIFFYGKSL